MEHVQLYENSIALIPKPYKDTKGRLWCWRRLLRVPWPARRSNQSILKEINPGFIGRTDVEDATAILWAPDAKSWLIWKDRDAGKDWRQEEKGRTEDEMVGWHHQLNGHEFEQALGDGEGNGSLACCSPWGRRVWHYWMTEQQCSIWSLLVEKAWIN